MLDAPVFDARVLDASRHHLDSFECGQPTLDRWLKQHAAGANARNVARTFVWAGDDNHVVGYFSLVGHQLDRTVLPMQVGRGSPNAVPAVLLARLALDKTLQGRGLGGELLADALFRVVAATQSVAARFLVVDAIDEPAANFYVHYGFIHIPGTPRLVRKISDIAADLAASSE